MGNPWSATTVQPCPSSLIEKLGGSRGSLGSAHLSLISFTFMQFSTRADAPTCRVLRSRLANPGSTTVAVFQKAKTFYRPQTFAKVIFLLMSVCPWGAMYPSMPCRSHDQPWGVSRRRPGGCPGEGPGGCIPACTEANTPPADGYCCGRYASCWNAFLFQNCSLINFIPVFSDD